MPFTVSVSKYRNAQAKVSKQDGYTELPQAGLCSSDASDSLDCSLKWLAYRSHASTVQLVDLYRPGRFGAMEKSGGVAVHHGGAVTDFKFSPFDSDTIATGGDDCVLRVWKVADAADELTTQTVKQWSVGQKRVECMEWHPSANGLLATASGTDVKIWDVQADSHLLHFRDHDDSIQSLSWKADGSQMATASKDCQLRLFDVRTDAISSKCTSHAGSKLKTSRVQWLGNRHQVLTTGFGAQRQREYCLYDTRQLKEPVSRVSVAGSSGTSLLIPQYDEDMQIVYLVAKGETSIRWMDLLDTPANGQHFTEMQSCLTATPISTATMLKKQSLRITDGEINRLVYLSMEQNNTGSLIPVSYTIARKSRDFSSELFGCGTASAEPHYKTADSWMQCKYEKDTDGVVSKVSLDPAQGMMYADRHSGKSLGVKVAATPASAQPSRKPSAVPSMKDSPTSPNTVDGSRSPSRKSSQPVPVALQNMRTSSYRYISGKPMHPRTHFEDVRNLNYGLSGESNVLQTNSKYVAFPLSGAGGRVGVLRADKPGRVQTVLPSVIGGCDVFDFALSRLSEDLMATGCDDGKLRLWRLPEEGVMKQDVTTPITSLTGHLNRINIVQWHPLIKNVLVSSSIEQMGIPGLDQNPTVKLWDVEKAECQRTLEGFEELVLSFAFSIDGQGLIGTTCKDRFARVFDPRARREVYKFVTHEGIRASRMQFVDKEHILTVGSGKGSQREVLLFNVNNLSSPVAVLPLDVSPSILVPHFDEDQSLVYLCGRGDTGILPVEVTPSHPTQPLFALPRFDSPGATIQQGVSFMIKRVLDVAGVELSRCWRLTQNSIEPITFSMPRNRREYFQDDIFPLARDDTQAMMSAEEWFAGKEETVPARPLNLCPAGMIKLSDAPAEQRRPSKYQLESGERPLTESQKNQKHIDGMFQQAKLEQAAAAEKPLVQDMMEGVAEDEWADY